MAAYRGLTAHASSRNSRVWTSVIRVLPWILVAPLFLVPFFAAIGAAPLSESESDGSWLQRIFDSLSRPSIQNSLQFSLGQAFLSTLLSIAVGIPGAFLLARFNFPGRKLYAALAALPFAFPPVLFSLGFIRAWGHNGLVNTTLMSWFGLTEAPFQFVYSFGGIVIAHTLLNFPLVVAMVSVVWSRLSRGPGDAARLLGATEWAVFRTITLPALLPGIAAAASLVFLYCFMSFAIPLTLGGGPEFATLEVSIYAAVSGEQDFARAGSIAALEGMCAIGVLILYTFFTARVARGSNDAPALKLSLKALRFPTRISAVVWLLATGLLALSPLCALIVSSFTVLSKWGGAPIFSVEPWVRAFGDPASLQAMGNSLALAALVAALSLTIVLILLIGERRNKQGAFRAVFFALPVALSSVMLSLGYLVLFPLGAGLIVLAAVQASAAYPLAWRTVSAARSRISPRLDDAAATLGAGKLKILTTIDFPLLRPALLSSLALCACVSLGEINAALMFNLNDFPLLGLRAFRLMGSYQYPIACALGVVLCVLGGLAFAAADKFSKETS